MRDDEPRLEDALPRAVLALVLSTIVYALGDLLKPGNLRLEILYYCLVSLLPALLLIGLRIAGVQIGIRVLAADLLWTLLVVIGMCLAPHATISGTAYLLSMKWLASAWMLPWPPRLQAISSAGGCLLYFLAWPIAIGDRPVYVHQWALPLVAAVLSVSGSRTLHRNRRAARAAKRDIAESEQRLLSMVNQSPDGILVIRAGTIAFANARLVELLGEAAPTALLSRPLTTIVRDADRSRLEEFLRAVGHPAAPCPALNVAMRRRDGSTLPVALTAASISERGHEAIQITVRDVAAAHHNQMVLEGEHRVLERIAGGGALADQLAAICQFIESIDPSVLASIQIVGEDGASLRHAAAPSLPPAFTALADGIRIADGVGSCGTAAHRRATVVVEDTAVDPLWQDFREPASAHGLASCWSTPILGSAGDLLGTFALYRRIPARPDDWTLQLVERTVHLAAIAIERHHEARNQFEQAELFGALARVSEALISSLDRPVLLECLCTWARQELHADVAHVFLRDPDDGTFVPVAHCGDSAENWELMRLVHMSQEHFGALEVGLRSSPVLQIGADDPESPLPAGLQARFGVRHGMFIALHRSDDLIGVLTLAMRSTGTRFTLHQERIARGIAQVASLALENARLHEELGRANEVKSNFVATMSHELRTPLNVLIGYPELLLAGELGPLTPEQREVVERLTFYARQLLVLVNDTLDLSRLDSGKMSFELRTVELRPFIDRVAAEAREAWGQRGLELEFEVTGEVELHTDPAKLHVILRSLLDNAVKFTPHGSVSVHAHNAADGVTITVSDSGIGIAAEAQQRIFDPFTQADPSVSRVYGGAGLGLHIVKRLVELFHGTIQVESELGRGTTFRIWLPARRDEPN